MARFRLQQRRWYAAEIIGEEFGREIRSYSPIRVERVTPKGGRTFEVSFYHANYPEGVRQKEYELLTLERNNVFILARSTSHQPVRWFLIHEVTFEWLERHFDIANEAGLDVEAWLERNA